LGSIFYGYQQQQNSKTSNMDHLPQEVINIIISFANPRLTDKLKIHIEIAGKIQSEMYEVNTPYFKYTSELYEANSPRFKYTYKKQNGGFRRERLQGWVNEWDASYGGPYIHIKVGNFEPPKDDKHYTNCGARKPFLCHTSLGICAMYDTRKELMEMLTNYYGGNKIPLISKLKTKKHIIQRIMSL